MIFLDGFLFGLGLWLALLCVLPVIGLVAFITHEIEKRRTR